jgi:hypothetical protein
MKIIPKFAGVEVMSPESKGIGYVLRRFLLLSWLINFNVPVLKSGIQRVIYTDNSFSPMAAKKNQGLGSLMVWWLIHI